MSNYTKATNFGIKDSLPSGNPSKIVKGVEINDEFDAIEVALNSKADINSPTFTGDPKAPTPSAGDNDTSIATTAFVTTAVNNLTVCSNQIGNNCVTADELDVVDDGITGQFLVSDGDGSMSWTGVHTLESATSDPSTRDDGTTLVHGDQYYNTTDDELRAWDGSAWNPVGSYDPSGGATGTTSIPPVGALVFGTLDTGAGSVGGYQFFNTGYGSTYTFNTSYFLSTMYTPTGVSGAYSSVSIQWYGGMNIKSGTWQLLGGTFFSDNAGIYKNFGLYVRIA